MGTFTGSPPTYDILQIPGTPSMRPPMFDFAKNFGDYLMQLIGQPAPSYGGQIDPGMSPTMQMMGVLSQMYANSPLPAVFGQAHGSLSSFMNPKFANPTARMQAGAPSYFGNQYGPGQQVPGGQSLSQLPYAGGMKPYQGFSPQGMTGPSRWPGGPPMPWPGGAPGASPTPGMGAPVGMPPFAPQIPTGWDPGSAPGPRPPLGGGLGVYPAPPPISGPHVPGNQGLQSAAADPSWRNYFAR